MRLALLPLLAFLELVGLVGCGDASHEGENASTASVDAGEADGREGAAPRFPCGLPFDGGFYTYADDPDAEARCHALGGVCTCPVTSIVVDGAVVPLECDDADPAAGIPVCVVKGDAGHD